jgi:hypothetical protein
MRWAAKRRAGVPGTWTWEHIFFHDLLDDEGNLLGYVREDNRPDHGFTPMTNINEGRAQFPTQSTLKDAKALLTTHFVLKKLEDT